MALLAVIALAVMGVGGYRVYKHWFPPVPPSPVQEIRAAASAARAVTSASATFTTQVSGLTVMFGTIRQQTSPTRVATVSMTSVDGAERFAVTEVVTLSNVYVTMPSLAAATGKPWLAVPVARLGADPAMTQLYQTGVLPTAETALVGTASTVRLAGTATVRGVPVSRYVGTIDPATALAAFGAQSRELLAPELTAVTGSIHFTAWIDAKHHLRKIETSAIVGGRRTVTTVLVTAFNRRMHIDVPDSSQVAS